MTIHHKKIARITTLGWYTAILLLILHGCTTNPIPHERLQPPEMTAIAQAYQLTVQEAYSHQKIRWHNGPIGNMVVNYWGEPNAGLCYQWQQLVFQGVHQRAQQLGWQAIGIRINKGTDHEHHAVVVFDPDQIQRNELLEKAASSNAYVLDPWRSGRADIYTLSDWLKLPRKIEVPAELKELKPGQEQ